MEGKFNGNGTLSLASGGTYSGAWVDGERTGQGTYRWPNGDKYTGSFVKGTLDGRGTLSANGQVQTGVWKNDKMLGEIELNHLIWTMLTNATGRTYVNCTVTRIDPVGISLSSS